MKRWAFITVILYGLLLLLLTMPLCLLGALRWGTDAPEWSFTPADLFNTVWYWVWLVLLMVNQALLLLVPVKVAERRPRARRSLAVPIVVATFLFTNLVFAGVFALLAAIGGDNMFEHLSAPFEWMAWLSTQIPGLTAHFTKAGLPLTPGLLAALNIIGLFSFFWLLWGLVFYHYAKADEEETLMRRVTRWLLRGSILELLVAVPSHIIVRSRQECCAPFATFWGIVTGLSVMLLSFGPGVLFLFARRIRERQGGSRSN